MITKLEGHLPTLWQLISMGKFQWYKNSNYYICRNGEVSLSMFPRGVMTHLLKGEELKLAAIGLLLQLSTVDCERVFCLSSVALSTELL